MRYLRGIPQHAVKSDAKKLVPLCSRNLLSARRARQIFQRQSLCLLTAPFLIDTEQLGCCEAILRFALWLGVRQNSFNCVDEMTIFIDLGKGWFQPSWPGYSTRVRIHKQIKAQPPPPPAEIKAPKRGQNGQNTLKCRCGYEGDPKIISPYKRRIFLAYTQKSHICTKNPKNPYYPMDQIALTLYYHTATQGPVRDVRTDQMGIGTYLAHDWRSRHNQAHEGTC